MWMNPRDLIGQPEYIGNFTTTDDGIIIENPADTGDYRFAATNPGGVFQLLKGVTVIWETAGDYVNYLKDLIMKTGTTLYIQTGATLDATGTLFVNTTTTRVGIRNDTPLYPLDVAGDINAGSKFRILGDVVLNYTTLGTSVIYSSLQTVGNLISATVVGTLTVGGDLNVDSGLLFVDVSADEIGIGTETPEYKLDIVNNTEAALRIKNIDESDVMIHMDANGSAGRVMVRQSAGHVYIGDIDDNGGNTIIRTSGENNGTFTRVSGESRLGIGIGTPSEALQILGNCRLNSGVYKIGSDTVLSGDTLGTGVINSSLRNFGVVSGIIMGGDINMDNNDLLNIGTISDFTAAGDINMNNNDLLNVATISPFTATGDINMNTNNITSIGTGTLVNTNTDYLDVKYTAFLNSTYTKSVKIGHVPGMNIGTNYYNSEYYNMRCLVGGGADNGGGIAFVEGFGTGSPALASIIAYDDGSGARTGLAFLTGNSTLIEEAFNIDSNGNIGIGNNDMIAGGKNYRFLLKQNPGDDNDVLFGINNSSTGDADCNMVISSDDTAGEQQIVLMSHGISKHGKIAHIGADLSLSTNADNSSINSVVNGNNHHMFWKSDGTVGINRGDPDYDLDILSAVIPTIRLETTTSNSMNIRMDNPTYKGIVLSRYRFGDVYIGDITDTGSDAYLYAGGTQAVRVKANKDCGFYGNLGIGTDSPNHQLDIHTDATSTIRIKNNTAVETSIHLDSSTTGGRVVVREADGDILLGDIDSGNTGEVNIYSSGAIGFNMNTSQNTRFYGYLGIGKTGTKPLDIVGNGEITGDFTIGGDLNISTLVDIDTIDSPDHEALVISAHGNQTDEGLDLQTQEPLAANPEARIRIKKQAEIELSTWSGTTETKALTVSNTVLTSPLPIYGFNEFCERGTTTTQSISNNTTTIALFPDLIVNTNSNISYVPSGNFYPQSDGLYEIIFNIDFDNNGSGIRRIYLDHQNSSDVTQSWRGKQMLSDAPSSENVWLESACFLRLVDGDRFRIQVYQNCGSSLNIGGGTTATKNHISIRKVGN